jgi:hypothetical protein
MTTGAYLLSQCLGDFWGNSLAASCSSWTSSEYCFTFLASSGREFTFLESHLAHVLLQTGMPSATNSGCATFDPSLQVHALPLQQPSATHSMPLKNIVQLLVGDQLRSTL